MQWSNWSETRWAGVGRTGRRMVASLAVGIEHIVDLLNRRATHNDRYYLGAATRMLSSAVRKYVCNAAVACRPVENVSLQLLKDDRFASICWEASYTVAARQHRLGEHQPILMAVIGRGCVRRGHDMAVAPTRCALFGVDFDCLPGQGGIRAARSHCLEVHPG